MLAVAKFLKTVFECDRVRRSALNENRGLFLVGPVSENSFSLSFCEFFAVFCQTFLFKFMSKFHCLSMYPA